MITLAFLHRFHTLYYQRVLLYHVINSLSKYFTADKLKHLKYYITMLLGLA